MQEDVRSNDDVIGGVLKQMKSQGIDMDLKKKNAAGDYENASPEDMEMLKTQAKLANTAQALQALEPEKRTEWALGVKMNANELYNKGDTKQAMDKYIEALAASCFDEGPLNNVDTLVTPVLCNLAACCIQIQVNLKDLLCEHNIDSFAI